MNNDLISRSALKRKFRNVNEGMFQLSRVYELIDNAPTIETSYDLYREETCDRKAHCYDYKYWHCIGCHGCKADEEVNKMNNKEEKALNDILDEIINFTDFIGKTSYENSLKSAQVVRDLSAAYLNVTEASEKKGGADND